MHMHGLFVPHMHGLFVPHMHGLFVPHMHGLFVPHRKHCIIGLIPENKYTNKIKKDALLMPSSIEEGLP